MTDPHLIKDEVLLTMIFHTSSDGQKSVHRKFKKIDQLIFRNAKEIYFNEKIPNSLIIYFIQNQNKLEIKF